jgi:hypothetical protein
LQYPEISLIRAALAVFCVANPADSVVTAFPIAQRPSSSPAKAGLASMLPGFRFLFAAIVLTSSILVFGLGAAALLRAAHEEFAANPSWRAAPEAKLAQASEAPGPVLAMLRLDPAAVERKASEDIPAAEPPAAGPAEPEKIAALQPQDSLPPEAAKPEMTLPETSLQRAAAPADSPAEEARIATAEQVLPPANEAVAPAAEPAIAAPAAGSEIAATRIATLGGPSVVIEAEPSAKAATANPDRSVVKTRLQARRTAQRRRAAQRARLARQAAAQQQAADPFAQPAAKVRSR